MTKSFANCSISYYAIGLLGIGDAFVNAPTTVFATVAAAKKDLVAGVFLNILGTVIGT